MAAGSGSGRGCWYSFMRCMSNGSEPMATHYQTREVESIKFEDLLTLEKREKESQLPLVTESELQLVKDGKLDKLAEEQLVLDRKKDEELRRQEEQLKQEEEAYYAAKRKATKKSNPITTQPSSNGSSIKKNGGVKKETLPTWLTESPTTSLTGSQKVSITESDEEEDFDIFLKNVKAKNSSLSSTSPEMAAKLHSITSDDEQLSEDEIDFGYWESASGPVGDPPKGQGEGIRSHDNLKEVDLNLL